MVAISQAYWMGDYRRFLPPASVAELRDSILTKGTLEQLGQQFYLLSIILMFNGNGSEANGILSAYFGACPSASVPADVKRACESFWAHGGGGERPEHVPWRTLGPEEQINKAAFDLGDPKFFELDRWTVTDWIPHTDYQYKKPFVPINDDYDMHAWKTSEDPWTHAICARLLCRVPSGEVASRDRVEEAFEAVDKLFTRLPKRKSQHGPEEEWPHSHLFPVRIYFLMALGLGKADKAEEILRMSCTPEEFSLGGLLEIPETFDILQKVTTPPATLMSAEEAAATVGPIAAALADRKQNGRREPLHGVAWPELLRRFSEAAFKAKRKTYKKLKSPSEILLPPLSAEEFAEVEQRLGPLPEELKEMSLVARGFKGGWHFAAGGFAGVDKLEKTTANDHEVYLDIEQPVKRVTKTVTDPDGSTRTVIMNVVEFGAADSGSGVDWGPVYEGFGAVECDSYTHLICPSETWKKIRGDNYEGGYGFQYYSVWGGTDGEPWRGIRHWVADMTAELERKLASGKVDEDLGDDDDDEDDEEEA